MMNCLIVDDEPLARRQIESYVEKIPFLNLVGTAKNPVIAQAILQTEAVDLIFLDIKMPHKSGIDFLRQDGIIQQVIFITAYPEYAVEGFELSATDYLMKPVTFERFYKGCEKALAKLNGTDTVKTNIEQPGFLFVKSNQRFEKILLKDILFIESLLNYVHVVTTDKKFIVYSSLKAMEANLPNERFIRVHKSYIISVDQIDAVDGSQLHLKNQIVPIGRAYRHLPKEILALRKLQ